MPDNRLPTNQSQLDIVEKLDEIKDAIAQGGGGSSTLDGLNDVDIDDTTLADGQALVYDEIEEKWVNGQGGGGTGGHTIIDENGNSMTARAGLQFVGANVDDDATNNKTIVDLASAGGIDGVFVDTENVIVPKTSYNPSSFSYTATEDCVLYIEIPAKGGYSTFLEIDGKEIQGVNLSGSGTTNYLITTIFLKKGQIATLSSSSFPSVTPDYAVYGIQTGTTHSKFQPVIYSLEEREIGVWEDGKPLYQKTWELTIPSGSGAYEHTFTEAAIPNLDKAVATSYSLFGIGERAYVPWYQQATVVLDEQSATGVTFYFASNNYAGRIIYYTAQYTKTTDVAGSGSWTPQGVPAHHYSTDEQIVGTYLDETLYEKTWVLENAITLAPDTWTAIPPIPKTLFSKIMNCEVINNAGSYVGFIQTAFDSAASDYLRLINVRNVNVDVKEITLKYTKSS